MHIGFLGLGNMGTPMAHNLLGSGHAVTVYNRTPGKTRALIAAGAKEATSVVDAVKDAEVAITMLSDDTAIKEVVHGPGGLLQNLPTKSIHLCMSTLEVGTSMELASAHAQVGQGYVAAPIFGRADTARSRHVWIVAGGPEPQVNRCRPIFEALSRGYTRVGPNAALAHALKLGGNLLTVAMELAVSEILTYAKQAGLPPADFLRFLNTAVFRSHMVRDYGTAIDRPSFDPEDRTLDLAANEMLLQAAKDMGVAIPVADLLNARLQAAEARGWGEQDLAELSSACRTETGISGPATPTAEPAATPAPDPIPTPTSMSNNTTISTSTPIPPPASVPAPAPIPIPIPAPAPLVVPKVLPPSPPISKPSKRSPREPRKNPDSKGTRPPEERRASPRTPPVSDGTPTRPDPAPAIGPSAPHDPTPEGHSSVISAREGGVRVMLDLHQTSHFEIIKGQVWAWSHGKCFETPWSRFEEVESAFKHTLFLPIKRHILLRPEAVQDLRSTFGGGAKARVGPGLELDLNRAAAIRLRELLGL
jgi:3-hydroxyisobutyrate dehydrogenase-like beta-hydroxyacid dehydrogenase